MHWSLNVVSHFSPKPRLHWGLNVVSNICRYIMPPVVASLWAPNFHQLLLALLVGMYWILVVALRELLRTRFCSASEAKYCFFVMRFDLLNLLLFYGGYRKKAFWSISHVLLEYVFFFLESNSGRLCERGQSWRHIWRDKLVLHGRDGIWWHPSRSVIGMNSRVLNSLDLHVVLSTDVVIYGLKCIFHILSVMCCSISWWKSIA